jgi:hypothetical protein
LKVIYAEAIRGEEGSHGHIPETRAWSAIWFDGKRGESELWYLPPTPRGHKLRTLWKSRREIQKYLEEKTVH